MDTTTDGRPKYSIRYPLIASENVSSPAVREAVASDFGHRYAEGWPGERVYAGCVYIDDVEFECMKLAKKLYFGSDLKI